MIVAVSALYALFLFSPSLRLLYLLPIWYATRLGGRRAGFTMIVLITVVLVAIDASRHAPGPIWLEAALAFAVLTVLTLVISQVESSLERHRHLAFHDPLTGLHNRRALHEYASIMFGQIRPDEDPLVVVLIDCDNFKRLNDRFGHHAGDHVLRILATMLEDETRSTDLVARIGGDEFVVVLHGIDTTQARSVMDRVEHLFEKAVIEAGYECTISVGYAPLDPESQTIEALLQAADKSMYAGKENKKTAVYLN